ncbi:hypothetical protein T12_11130 [Trichinella patagoniensis]|uniref:Uncharacterized protein n=1 Tax=Trichinella patagoniensis TaxID=990121 RepID=A0A0V0ZPN2_9BILA|nr:hypothetical protein T12_11130 [Trichinella patagoniensis]
MAVVVGWKLLMELHIATSDEPPHLDYRRQITIPLLHARPFDDVQFVKNTAKMNVFSAEKSYTEIVFSPTTYETFNIGLLGKSLSPNAKCQKNWFVKIEALTQGEPNSTTRQLIKCVINEKHGN